MQGMYSMRSPAVKRLMKEAQELSEPTEQYYCQPLEDNLFEWHFTIRGPADTEFDGGLYHGRIVLPPEYPMKPPSIILLTHNGRFETNKKICLSISGHHPESWQPSWSIRTALLAIIGFMPTHGAGALGSLDYTPEERKVLARRSIDFKCSECGPINHTLKAVTEASLKTTEEAKQLAAQMDFKDEKEKNAALKKSSNSQPNSDNVDGASPKDNPPQTSTGARPKVQTVPAGPQPMQFGQYPMPMPFMPPFPMQGNMQNGQQQENNIMSQVPRFPLPFVGPVSPPFMPFMPPMMPGMNFPPMPYGGATLGTNGTVQNPQNTIPGTAQTIFTQSPSTSGLSNGRPDSTPTEITQTSTEASATALTTTTTSTTTTTTTSTQQENTTTATPATTNTSEGLRQRNIQRESTSQPTVSSQSRPASTVVPSSSQRESPAFIAFAVIIIALIAMLLIRRLYILKYLPGLS